MRDPSKGKRFACLHAVYHFTEGARAQGDSRMMRSGDRKSGNDRGKDGEGEVTMRVLLKLWGCAIVLAICVAWLAHRSAHGQPMSLAAGPIGDPAKLRLERQRE
ncbi:hypothetical protein GR157_18640 [Burkholderia sp. 4701]|nr:hypothetical protein [Burkholderia sp. 4701]MXN83683.1 hypothetical protein [Burkholderia sp. 4812]